MPRQLADFISREVYGGLLVSAASVSADPAAVTWADVPGGVMEKKRGSLANKVLLNCYNDRPTD